MTVHTHRDPDGIVTLTLDMTGPVNTMNADFTALFEAAVDELEADQGLTGVVLASAKKTFFAGGDLKMLLAVEPGSEPAFFAQVEHTKGVLRRLERLPVPVAAAINGAALGGGFELCLCCNHRVAWNDRSVKIGFPEVTLGLLPGGGGTVRTTHLLGLQAACRNQAVVVGWGGRWDVTLQCSGEGPKGLGARTGPALPANRGQRERGFAN